MSLVDKLLELLGIGGPEMGYDTIKEPGTTQPPLDEGQKKLMEELADTEVLVDIYNAQRTMEQPQVELGARYMDKYRTEVPGGLASLMFQPVSISKPNTFGTAVPERLSQLPDGTFLGKHQILLKSIEDLEKFGFKPEKRDQTLLHELAHIGEFVTYDNFRDNKLQRTYGDFGGMKHLDGTIDQDLAHTVIHALDDYYGPNQKYRKLDRFLNESTDTEQIIGNKAYDKEKVRQELKAIEAEHNGVQAEINAEMKRIGKGNWNDTLEALTRKRKELRKERRNLQTLTQSYAIKDEEGGIDFEFNEPTLEDRVLEDIFDGGELKQKLLDKDMRNYFSMGEEIYNNAKGTPAAIEAAKAKIRRNNELRSKGYGFDVTNLTPENVDKIIDLMKKHTITANEIAEKIIEQGSY
tara:strand:- start:1174 stop:2397 length:1224 start_codon:yes stop_codon:yes gene_type:complete